MTDELTEEIPDINRQARKIRGSAEMLLGNWNALEALMSRDGLLALGRVIEAAQQMSRVMDATYIEPCHVTGEHNPNHTDRYLCRDQSAKLAERLARQVAGDLARVPHRLHKEGACYWCHNIPDQEGYREKVRDLHRWAGVPISEELAALAPDAPREGDVEELLANLTDEYETWQVIIRRLSYGTERLWAAVRKAGPELVWKSDIAVRRPDWRPGLLVSWHEDDARFGRGGTVMAVGEHDAVFQPGWGWVNGERQHFEPVVVPLAELIVAREQV